MSNNIDQRIVEMQFDNQQFERGIKNSVSSLDKLKKSLDLNSASKSLNQLNDAGKRFSLSGIASGIDAINSKFNALGVVGFTIIQNLTNSALNAGKRIVSALTIDPIKSGLQEYETKMNAITTILTNTRSKGTTLQDVNEALQELNVYADKTIYNFAEMTRNIGTFTAAGIDLKTATNSIKGIANLAAGSGSSAQQAATAMYQLSQALSAGRVQLQDWNSVVNAGMGGELFRNALMDKAKEMGVFVDQTKSFRDTLQEGWLSADILSATLTDFATKDKWKFLEDAATDVKTITQLFSVMQESVQSGWSETWEKIIGDRDSAIKLLSAIAKGFGEATGASAESRNKLLEGWSEGGGREDFILGLANALKALASVLEPIEQAFVNIFPPVTVETLLALSKRFKELTERLIIGEKTSNNLRSVFQGLFSVLSIGLKIIGAVLSITIKLISHLKPLASFVLNISANVSALLTTFNSYLKTSNIINKSTDKVNNGFIELGRILMVAISRFKPLLIIYNGVEYVFKNILTILKNIIPYFYKFSSAVASVFKNLGSTVMNAMFTSNFNSIFDTINSGLFGLILLGLRKFIKSLTDITSSAGGFVDNLTGILDGVKGSLQAYQSQLKANILIKISIAIGILAAALLTLSLIDSDKLTSSLSAMTIMFVQLFGAMAVFEKLLKGPGFLAMVKITSTMIGLSIAVGILSLAITNLATLEWDGIAKGLTGVAGASLVLIGASKLLEKSSAGMIRSSLGFILFGTALIILSSAVKRLGEIDTEKLKKGLLSIGGLLVGLALFLKITDLSGMGVRSGIGLIALAVSLKVLAGVVQKLSEIDTNSLIKGLASVAILLTQLALFVKLTGDSKKVISTAIGLTILGGALIILSNVLINMGSMSWDSITRGLVSLAGSLTIIALAMRLMPGNMILNAAGLLLITSSLIVLSNALINFSSLSWEEIGKSLLVLAGSLGIIAGAMFLMTTALPGAAALIIVAGALAILAPVLMLLGSMSLKEIGLSLLALAGAFTVIGLAGLVLTPLIPSLLGLSAAITLIGIGVGAVGLGILAFSAALTALSVSGAAGAAALVVIVTSIIGLIPMAVKTLAVGIIEFVKTIGEGIPIIITAIKDIIKAILDTLVELLPLIFEVVDKLLDGVIDILVKYIPKIVEAIITIIIAIADSIYENKEEVTNAISYLVDVILEVLGGVVMKVFNLGKDIATGLKDGIVAYKNKVVESTKDLGSDVIKGVKNVFGIRSPSRIFKSIGENITKSLGIGITENKSGTEKIAEDLGKSTSNATANGITNNKKSAEEAAKELAEAMRKAYEEAMAWVDEEKYYNRLSLESELEKYLEMQKIFKEGTEERRKLNREVYRVELALIKQEEEANKKALEEEKKLYNEKYQHSLDWIEEEKYYKRIALTEELAAWERVQARYLKGSEERKKADREVFRLKNEINKSNEDYEKKINDIVKDANDKRIKMEDDYYRKTKDVNDRLKQDIKSVTDAYEQAVKSRTDSLYSSYGLFDKVEERETSDGLVLMSNLKDQVVEFDSWRKAIQELAAKGVDEGLISELEKMGPKSIEQIRALNRLNTPLLNEYVQLWKTKNKEARSQATQELEGLRKESINKIAELNKDATKELDDYRRTWADQLKQLQTDTKTQMTTVRREWMTEIGELKSQTEKEMFLTTYQMQNAITKPDWSGLGRGIVSDITKGVQSESMKLIEATVKTVKDTLSATDKELGIHVAEKPSNTIVSGATNVVKSFVDSVKSTVPVVTNALQGVVLNVKNALADNIDSAPTIRPVLDLSAIKSGGKLLSSMFGSSPLLATAGLGMNLAGSIGSPNNQNSLLSSLSSKLNAQSNKPTTVTNEFKIGTVYVREEADVQKVARELNNMQKTTDRG